MLPRADIVLDFHSGGKTLDFVSFCAAHILSDKEQEKKSFAAVEAFSAPFSMKMLEIDTVGMYDTAAEDMGKIFVTTELGGGTSRAETVRIAKRGVLNVLRHSGIVSGEVEHQPTCWLDMPSGDCFSFAEDDGMIEPLVDLGEPVREGQAVARIYAVSRTDAAPAEIKARMSGILAARHFPGLVQPGDCVAVIAALVD